MTRLRARPWFHPAVFAALGLACMGVGLLRGALATVLSGVLVLLLGAPYAPALRVRSRPFAGVQDHLARGGAAVFWRPGCRSCMDLIRSLTPQERAGVWWVNIWAEPEAAEALRQLHAARDGHAHEAVPTAWWAGGDMVVADDAARARLRGLLRADGADHRGGER